MSDMEATPHAHAPDSATPGPSSPVARWTIDGPADLNKGSCSSVDDPVSLSSDFRHTFSDLPAPSHILYPNTRAHTHTAELDMPLFSFPRFFGRGGGTAAATSPSKSSMSYTAFNNGDRAKSEPLQSQDDDVDMGSALPRSRSEFSLPLSEDIVMKHNRCDTQPSRPITTNSIDKTSAEENEEQSQSHPRPPSPVPTEVFDPDSQDVMADILRKGVKIRDFAYISKTASTSTSSSSDSLPPTATTTSVPFKPAVEIFDQYKGLAEVEFRWTQPTRIYPIAGKTLRRLLDMKWIKQEEVDARAHPMDLEDLKRHDSRPIYPWRPFRWTSIPCLENRRDMANARTNMFNQLDRIRASSESAAQRRRIEEAQAEVVMARYEEMMQERRIQMERMRLAEESRRMAALVKKLEAEQAAGQLSPGRKRRLLDVEEGDENAMEDEADPFSDAASPKKRRLTPEVTPTQSQYLSQPQPLSLSQFASSQARYLFPPEKQYPAPLHTYDPEIYPEAASFIGSSSQSQSQPRPVVPQRTDTPPLDEDDEGGGAAGTQELSPGKRGAKLVHPRERKAMKRALSRTQTFAQLIV